jgi:hypothetical protein
MELADLIERYHELKETKLAIEVEQSEVIKPYTQALQAIETECLARLQAQGLQNAKTPHGTAYLATQTRVSVRDKQAFFEHMLRAALEDVEFSDIAVADMLSGKCFAMLDIRALKEPVKEFVKEHNANPPGVEVSHWVECNIRKS